MIRNLKKIIKNILNELFMKFKKFQHISPSYSQAGEDRVLAFLFGSMGMSSISYIDIGANHPIINNNTFLFYSAYKSTGILIEPDRSLCDEARKNRKKDTIIQAAIYSMISAEKATFYVFDNNQIGTLSKERAEITQKSGIFKLIAEEKVSILTIEQVIKEYLHGRLPDLISLDAEGVDYEVFYSFDFDKYPVPVWLVETCEYSENHIKPKSENILKLMAGKGYFVYADTYINTIFVNKKWFYGHKS